MSALAQISSERHGEVVVARIRGEIDASNTPWIGARIRALLTNRTDALVVDLTDTQYLDSAGVALLFGLASELALHQQQLQLVVVPGAAVGRIVGLTGLDRTAPVHPSVDEALAAAGVADRVRDE